MVARASRIPPTLAPSPPLLPAATSATPAKETPTAVQWRRRSCSWPASWDITETKIEDATVKDGKVSFTVTRERNGNKIVQKFSGKLEGDTLKLKIEREGQEAREVEAKRAAD